MQIIISCAGLGSRFKDRGFITPKHLIKIDNKTLIELAVESLDIDGDYFFILQKNDEDVKNVLKRIKPNCKIIEIEYLTEGPASSAYLLKDFLNSEDELIITNCDQILEYDSTLFLNKCRHNKFDCSVLTYSSNEKKNSFIRIDENNNALEIKEKEQISDIALVGVHYFKKSKYFVENYEKIYSKDIRVNNEFYVSTVCNEMILNGHTVQNIMLNPNEKYHSTGTPECYFKYLRLINKLNIKTQNLNETVRGWFIGDFEPSFYKTNEFEVGYLFHKKGEKWDVHYHENITEINLLIDGKMILNDIEINKNEVFIINKNEIACPIFLEDCYIICVKTPGILKDKVII
jgi:dTDP-glucose pyrophosphorylase